MDNKIFNSDTKPSNGFNPSNISQYIHNKNGYFGGNNISLDYFKTIPKVPNDIYLCLYTPLDAQDIVKTMGLESKYINFVDIFVMIPILMKKLWNNITLVGNNKCKGSFDMKKILEIWIFMFGAVDNEFEYKQNKKFDKIKFQFGSEIKQTFNTYNNLYHVNDVINHFNHTFVGSLFFNIIKTLQPQLINVAIEMINRKKNEYDTQRSQFEEQFWQAQYLKQLQIKDNLERMRQMVQMQPYRERQEGEEGQEMYSNQSISTNDENKSKLDVEWLNEVQKDDHNSFDDILSNHSLLLHKQTLSDNGLCSIDDFKLITTRDELNQVVKDMELPYLVQKKFIKLCLQHTQIDDYEGIEL